MGAKQIKIALKLALLSLAMVLVLGGLGLERAEAALYPAAKIINLSEDSDVTVKFISSEAALNSSFGLWSPVGKELGSAKSTAPGTEFNLGRFSAGTELVFYIKNSEGTWLTGPGERNSDRQVHAAVSEVGAQSWTVGFEDLRGGGDRDFNDVILLVSGNFYIDDPPYNSPPIADAGGPYTADVGSPVIFDGSGSFDPDGDSLQYRWDFDNDGQWDTGWSTEPTAAFTWNDVFQGTVKLEVSDGELTATDTAEVTITEVLAKWYIYGCKQQDTGNDWICAPGFLNITQTGDDLASTTIIRSDTNGDGDDDSAEITVNDGYGGYYNSIVLDVKNTGPEPLQMDQVILTNNNPDELELLLKESLNAVIKPGRRKAIGIALRVNDGILPGDFSFTVSL